MCFGLPVTVAMVGVGAAAAVHTARIGRPAAVPLALGYFALMEALQAAGYLVIDRCGSPANQVVTYLSMLHIAFQPFVINAFAMELTPGPVSARTRWLVYLACAVASVVMLLQLYPFGWATACTPGSTLCGAQLCTVWGTWHLAWDVPYANLFAWAPAAFGWQTFPSYLLAVFLLPVLYGAWRFALFHLAVGPVLAGLLTDDPNEVPAIWCLFSIGILLLALTPGLWRSRAPGLASAPEARTGGAGP
jgi:hypothetical protein